MRLGRAIRSWSTAVILLAGVFAFSAESGLPVAVPTGGGSRFGADVGPDTNPTMDPETERQAAVAALDDSCLAGSSELAVESVTRVSCAEPAGGRPPAPAPEKLLCIDIFDPDCFMGCCAGPGQANKWRKCVADCPDVAGGTCPQPDCATACSERFCSPGPF